MSESLLADVQLLYDVSESLYCKYYDTIFVKKKVKIILKKLVYISLENDEIKASLAVKLEIQQLEPIRSVRGRQERKKRVFLKVIITCNPSFRDHLSHFLFLHQGAILH